MKTKKQEIRRTVTALQERPVQRWAWWAAAAGAIIAVFWAYGPALQGPFLFDDVTLPFSLPGFNQPLLVWIRAVRPFLRLTYWLNAQISADNPYSYHVVNVLLHYVTSGLVFLIVRRLLGFQDSPEPRRSLLAAFAAVLFLLHPAQTETVAYLAGRSEGLSVLLVFAAFAVFLYRRQAAASWGVAALVLVLFAAAVLSKEHAVILAVLLLLTDYWWNPGFSFSGIPRNWKVYLPIVAAGAVALKWFLPIILHAETAGFGMKDLPWYQYFFTQCRALFVYIGMFLLPIRLNADWDFPFSRTLFDHGAIVGLAALLALSAAAWHFRRRFPLACYGFFVFLVLMAPTSSILPIRDPIAERRLYFSMLGLILIVVDLLDRAKLDRQKLLALTGVVAVVAAVATHARAEVWSDGVTLWQDTVSKSPGKVRAHLQLASAYFEQRRYDLAAAEYERTAQLAPPSHDLLANWGLCYYYMNRPQEALAKLREAAAKEPTAYIYSQIGMIHASLSQWPEALEALAQAEKLDPNLAFPYNYRAKIHMQKNEYAAAVADYKKALSLNPNLADAREELTRALALLRANH
jgi:tetratricopeptide (TPR) repeat protein